MSFLYPRTITVTRPNPETGFGAQPYSAVLPTDETQILSAVTASIQNRRKGMSGRGNDLPSDSGKTDWAIFIPFSQAALGSIAERDIVTDDLGKRYQVAAAWWDSLGYQLVCSLLQP
jgi:hypothetical protein